MSESAYVGTLLDAAGEPLHDVYEAPPFPFGFTP